MLLGDFARGTTMIFIMRMDRAYRAHCFFRRVECEHALTAGQPGSESRVLCNDGPPTCHIHRAAFAEPAAATRNVAVLRDRELRFRLSQVILVHPRVTRNFDRIPNAPPGIP